MQDNKFGHADDQIFNQCLVCETIDINMPIRSYELIFERARRFYIFDADFFTAYLL